MVFVRPCPLVHRNCSHCKVHLLVSKTITLKFTENICCVDIVWRGENQNKTNEEHPPSKQFRNNADTLCYKPFWMSFHGNLIEKMLLKVMIDPTFYVLGCSFVSGTRVWDCTSYTSTLSKVWPWHVPSANYFFSTVFSSSLSAMEDPWEEKWPRILLKSGGKRASWNLSDLWHIRYFSETLPMATRSDWSTGAWPEDCSVRIAQSACRMCA